MCWLVLDSSLESARRLFHRSRSDNEIALKDTPASCSIFGGSNPLSRGSLAVVFFPDSVGIKGSCPMKGTEAPTDRGALRRTDDQQMSGDLPLLKTLKIDS